MATSGITFISDLFKICPAALELKHADIHDEPCFCGHYVTAVL
jgi:hypothetical protein